MKEASIVILILFGSTANATLFRQEDGSKVILTQEGSAQFQSNCAARLDSIPVRQSMNTCQCLEDAIRVYWPASDQNRFPKIDWNDVREVTASVKSSGRFTFLPDTHSRAQKRDPVLAEIVEMCATEGILLR